jgi:hypothetical protein
MAWQIVGPILEREGIARDVPQLLAPLRAAVDATAPAARRRALTAAAKLGTDGHSERLLRALAGSDEVPARRLALELVARLPTPHEPTLTAWIRPLLRDRRIRSRVRVAAAARLFRLGSANDGVRVLSDFAAGYGRSRFVARRAKLRKWFAARGRVFDRFADRLPLTCPRCRVTQHGKEMTRHLWERHRRLVVGGRDVSPWRLIDRWAAEAGPIHAHRQLLRLGGHDEDSLAAVRRDAARRLGTVCPQCFAVAPSGGGSGCHAAVTPLIISQGRLARFGYVLELSRRRFASHLRIETPGAVLLDGPEPGSIPRLGWHRLAPVAVVALAVGLAAALPPGWALAGTLLALAAGAWLATRWRSSHPDEWADRLVDHAWRLLVPHLHSGDFDPDEADYSAALAMSSIGRGDPHVRARSLRRLVDRTGRAIRAGMAEPGQLLALQRLVVADAEPVGGDVVQTLAEAATAWLVGAQCPAAADDLLSDDLLTGLSRGHRARLRVLLVARSFAAGLGVWDLHGLGRAVPQFGRVIDHEDTDGLARLRMVWDLRPVRPWQRCGPAATVFELANYPMLGAQHLETAPDLLLFQPLPAGDEPVHLLACGRGLIVGGALLHEWPTTIDTRPLPLSKGGGYEMRFGGRSIQVHGNPDDLVRRVAAWAEYWFNDFLPWIGNALTSSGDGVAGTIDSLAVTCRACGTSFFARGGDVGLRR